LAAFTLFLIFINLPITTLRGSTTKQSRQSTRLLHRFANWFIMTSKGLRKELLGLFVLVVSFLIPLILTVCFFFITGALGDFIHSAFLANVGYVNYGNQFYLPAGRQVPQG